MVLINIDKAYPVMSRYNNMPSFDIPEATTYNPPPFVRMWITCSGNIGIGAICPSAFLNFTSGAIYV